MSVTKTKTVVKSVRLSNYMKEDILNNILDKKRNSLYKRINGFPLRDYMEKLVLKKIPKGFHEWMEACPIENYDHFYSISSINIKNNGNIKKYYNNILDIHEDIKQDHNGRFYVRIPTTGCHTCSYKLEDFDIIELPRLDKLLTKLQPTYETLISQKKDIQAILSCVATTKQLHNIWPEGYQYYKNICDGKTKAEMALIPQSQIDRINQDFKLIR